MTSESLRVLHAQDVQAALVMTRDGSLPEEHPCRAAPIPGHERVRVAQHRNS